MRQAFDCFLVLDFEATCAEDRQIVSEIIEFPVILVDGQSLQEITRFHRFVKPRITPNLTDFCTQLTGIPQETVDAAAPFPVVWAGFRRWMQEQELVDEETGEKTVRNLAFATIGNWDLAVALPDELTRYGLRQPEFMLEWINVKQSFKSVTRQWPKGLSHMLAAMNVRSVGRAHSGIDDCRNTLLLMRKLAETGHEFAITNSCRQLR